MVNLIRSNTAWNELAERLGAILGLYRREEVEANWWIGPHDGVVAILGDQDTSYNPMFRTSPADPFVLNGVVPGSNTTKHLLLYGRLVTDGSGNTSALSLFTDTARTVQVAQVSGTPAATSGTPFLLVATASSGLSGSGVFARNIGATQTKDFVLFLHVPMVTQIRRKFTGTGAGTLAADQAYYSYDETMRSLLVNLCRNRAVANRGGVMELLETFLDTWVRDFLGSQKPLLLPGRTTRASGGTVTTERVGLLADMYDAMVDNSDGGANGSQGVADCTVSLGGQTPDASTTGSNDGRVSIASISAKNYIGEGKYTLECIQSFANTGDGRETFRLRFQPSSWHDTPITAENVITIEGAWESVVLGCALTVNRGTAAESGTNLGADIGYISVSGLRPTNSNDGRLYLSVQDEAPVAGQFTIRVFRSSAGQADQALGYDDAHADLVAKGAAADGGTCICTPQNASGLTLTLESAAGVSASSYDDLLDLFVCSAGDTWLLSGTNERDGRFADLFGRLTGVDLGDIAPPGNEWAETLCVLDPTGDYTPRRL